jgi:hypothetical protein
MRQTTEVSSWILTTLSSLAMPLQPWHPHLAEPSSRSPPSRKQLMSIQDGSIWFNTTDLTDSNKQCPQPLCPRSS